MTRGVEMMTGVRLWCPHGPHALMPKHHLRTYKGCEIEEGKERTVQVQLIYDFLFFFNRSQFAEGGGCCINFLLVGAVDSLACTVSSRRLDVVINLRFA